MKKNTKNLLFNTKTRLKHTFCEKLRNNSLFGKKTTFRLGRVCYNVQRCAWFSFSVFSPWHNVFISLQLGKHLLSPPESGTQPSIRCSPGCKLETLAGHQSCIAGTRHDIRFVRITSVTFSCRSTRVLGYMYRAIRLSFK